MKTDIHPQMQPTLFSCACGARFEALSILGGESHADVCSACHPFFTGKEKFVDTAGRIEKFRQRYSQKPEKKPRAARRKTS